MILSIILLNLFYLFFLQYFFKVRAQIKRLFGYNHTMKKTTKTLIHTALFAEAKPIVRHFGLKCVSKMPFNVYENEKIVLVVSGIGAENTAKALKFIFESRSITKAINVGIAGCKDKNVALGTLFCATHQNLDIPYATLSTFKNPVNDREIIDTLLADQEGEVFLKNILPNIETYIFKIVSDHLDPSSLTKEKAINFIQKTIPFWSKYV